MTEYTLESLCEVARNASSPEAREIAVRMAYTMGRHDEVKDRIRDLEARKERADAA